jgi:hypothetical protein
MSNPPLHIKGALLYEGEELVQRDFFIQIPYITEKPANAVEVDLSGYILFPALVNAHDHLELNHFPRTKFREVYENAHQWGEDVNARLNDEPFKTLRSYPLWDRVFIGGLKNLLCGATTVAHHGPKHKPMYRKDFPVRVLKNYGWAHSLHFSSDEEIVRSYQSTPKNWPWFIHLAEGTDELAASEYQVLKKMGCVGENTFLVHAVGLNKQDLHETFRFSYGYGDISAFQRPIVWCPTTNIYLLNKTAFPREGWNTHYMLGSDSRLTADGDLLDEIRFVAKHLGVIETIEILYENVNRIYRDDGEFDYLHDYIVLPSVPNFDNYFCSLSRKDLPMVIFNGIPQIGAPELMARFPHIQTVACTLDGVEKRINVELARQIHRCTLKEQGLEVDALPSNKKFIFF